MFQSTKVLRMAVMKRIAFLTLAVLAFSFAVGAWAQEVSLGDYARKQREQKKPASPTTKVFTNDDISASAGAISTAGAPAAQPADTDAAKDSADKKDKASVSENRDKEIADWKAKIAEQKAKISALTTQLDVANREYKLRSIEWYTQTGNALLDPKKWHDQEEKYQKEIADAQKKLDEAKAELDKMRDDIRKAGLPSSAGD